jgi:hypothetical protein
MNDNSIYKPKTKAEVSYKVWIQASYFDDFARIFIPNHPFDKLKPGEEARNTATTSSPKDKENQEDNIERSIRRSVKNIKGYVWCNSFDLFATFTFREDRQDIDKCKKKMSNWLKNRQKRNGAFRYLIIPEFHDDGNSLHFHAMLGGYTGKLVESVNPKTGKLITQKGRQIYEFPGYTLGFTNVQKIGDKRDDQRRTGYYLMKYITKDMPLFSSKNRYWVSSGLKKPIVEDNPETWYLYRAFDRSYETEWGIVNEYDNVTYDSVAHPTNPSRQERGY